MAVTNRNRIDKMFEILTESLSPFAEKHLFQAFQGNWTGRVEDAVNYKIKRKQGGAVQWDAYLLLKSMNKFWMEAFSRTLGLTERAYVNELLDLRNDFSHSHKPYSSDDTYRGLDTAKRLLTAVSAARAVDEVQKLLIDLQRTVFDEQKRNEARKLEPVKGQPVAGLKPWREVVTPHRDVSSGNYMNAEFAADLAQVHRGGASEEYQSAKEFFSRTFLTQGLKDLLGCALQRLAGKGGDPIVQLQTNFGGGKTHSMLALYHLFGGSKPGDLSGIEALMKDLGIDALPTVKRVVLVGTARGPADTIEQKDGTSIQTLWGDLAWQLGGKEAFKLVAEADAKRVSPGSETLVKLFDKFGPALILIDEWVAYVRQLYQVDGLPGGSFDANLTFAQSLTEAAKAAKQTMVVASLPASNMEVGAGGEGGEKAMERLRHTFGRVDAGWRPATADEGFEIVRRRLFEPLATENYAHRDLVIQKFIEMYREGKEDYPNGCSEGDYKRRMERAYPIHPELFDKLYNVWGSLEKFQKTRGVLRLMAMVIHYLWEHNDACPLILPASMPIYHIHGELNRYTEDTWAAIIQNDIDSEQSVALKIDRENQRLGKISAARKVARAIFIGSAPTHKDERGIDVREIFLACMQPGENLSSYADALNKISDRAQYLHFEGQRYWFSTRANIARTAADRAEQIQDYLVEEELVVWLKKESPRGDFAGVHCVPKATEDVPDEMEARLVILGPQDTYNSKTPDNLAVRAAKNILQHRGTGQRIYRNTLFFAAPDENLLPQLLQNVKHYMAWRDVVKDEEVLQLTPQLKKQAEAKRKSYEDAIKTSIRSTWIWVIYPHQDSAQDDIEWVSSRVNGQDDLVGRIGKKMIEADVLTARLGPKALHLELEKYLWKSVDHLNTRKLLEYFVSYLYLPKLRDKQVLQQCINEEIGRLSGEFFGYADAYNEETKRYEGLRFGGGGNALIDGNSVIVKPEVALRQIEKETPSAAQPLRPIAGGDGINPTESTAGKSSLPTKFVGSVELNPDRVGRDAGRIADEVLSHLVTLKGAKAKVVLEVQIDVPEGVEESVQRCVSENSNVLKFTYSGFED